jgi:hypothetical protein
MRKISRLRALRSLIGEGEAGPGARKLVLLFVPVPSGNLGSQKVFLKIAW